jgi:DNA polymerase-3 subunit delta
MANAVDPSKHIVEILGEELLISRELQSWVSTVLPEGRNDTNYFVYDAQEDSPEQIVVEMEMMSMFASVKVLVVKGFERASTSFVETLLPAVEASSVVSYLFILGVGYPSVEKKLLDSYKKAVKKNGLQRSINSKDFDGKSYIEEVIRGANMKIQSAAIQQLVRDCASPVLLQNELEKLICFVDKNATITTDDIDAITQVSSELEIWDLTNAILKRDVNKALSTVYRMFKEEKEPHYLFNMVLSQVRKLSILQEHILRNTGLGSSWGNARNVSEITGLLKKQPFITSEVLRRMVEANRFFNSRKADAHEHFHALIVSLCS